VGGSGAWGDRKTTPKSKSHLHQFLLKVKAHRFQAPCLLPTGGAFTSLGSACDSAADRTSMIVRLCGRLLYEAV
jgi:hypothetical protein